MICGVGLLKNIGNIAPIPAITPGIRSDFRMLALLSSFSTDAIANGKYAGQMAHANMRNSVVAMFRYASN
jgi:hypothetical protein